MTPLIKPIGVGDLKVTKLKLVSYEAGEVAHIENVMASESHSRKHRRLRQIEEIQELEQERLEENVHDLQSTERFEIQTESKTTIRSETSFQAGLDVSASFGPVSIGASAKFATSTSKEESDSNSNKYAKDITEKTLARLVEKVRQERRTRTLEEVEEQNEHGFDNTAAGSQHISGIYRWVDKYYRAKVVDYGRRLMYEFMVPEPAAFYIFTTQYNLKNKILPLKPDAPTRPGSPLPLSASDIDRTNYLDLVKQYKVIDVQPPPPEYATIGKAIHREFRINEWAFSTEDFKLPKGYGPYSGVYNFSYIWNASRRQLHILVGVIGIAIGTTTPEVFPALTGWPLGQSQDEQNFIPLSGTGFGFATLTFNFYVTCRLIPGYYEKWKLETYAAIMKAYNRAVMDYEDRVAAAQTSQGVVIGGENPGINREIEKRELRRACLTMWTNGIFNGFRQAIDENPSGQPPQNYPEINLANSIANATEIEFFEKAFDWKNITYEFMPYFWGRKPRWLDMIAQESKDPIFESFLQAGAARVVVPVTPTYAGAVLYYQLTGSIWPGGAVPPFDESIYPDAQLYNSYLNELEGSIELPDIDRDIPIDATDASTWLTKVPTTLVWLQSDRQLPNFEP